ncbi:MAG: hypothetical protein DWQ44_00140 [Bacteroidetes bacterium]|nr:MAG: hypothetical protein DWQ33_05090 [Bacteroidota bacterium]REK06039.1 MAG: hypothetical protein DWQ39_04230 [Bacteroidota bacterium]REK37097.1 MAG: hypothetical protein DWQ44_00140 [Bacteroidota bacterium]REK47510.1 MAG: hypothetical protein DWQ48_12305 [Bacteroidota bacterium]
MKTEEILRLNEELIDSWNRHDVNRFLSHCDESLIWRDTANPLPYKGKDGARDFFNHWFRAFPDLNIRVLNRVASESSIGVEVEYSGTHLGHLNNGNGTSGIAATKRKIISKGSYFVKARNGKITDVHSYPDMLHLMIQLGILSEMHR